ncbi:tripartite tricarboxylate transporter substrate binding protein [Polaromonas hydrogenivorans]|uniref:Tripartite tricarboxylate transporter substrate binding protein n=1 Tax=Polaromonas hydrogenivorans TaxID=335476 RepID=A0AAU7LXZ6_9BURK
MKFPALSRRSPARRATLRAATGITLFAAIALAFPAWAQKNYPSKPVKLVVGFPPGGSNDIVARIITPALSEILGAQVIVDNRAGASGILAAGQVAKSVPDGYTLMLSSASPLVIAPHTLGKLPFDVNRDFLAINTVGLTPEAVAVGPNTSVKSFKELIELSKTQDVTISSSGNGGLPHLTIELLKQASKGRIIHVAYKGAGPAITDTLAGHVNAVTMDLTALIPFIRDGRLKPLAVTSDKRVDFLPQVPTVQEEGLPSFSAVNWLGIFAPAGTPKSIIDQLHAAIEKVMANPQVRAQLTTAAVIPNTSASPQAFQAFVAQENKRWARVVTDSGAKSD